MVKTIKLNDDTYKKLSRYGSVGQSFNDLIEDIIEYLQFSEDEFETFLDNKYEEEDEEEDDE